MIRPWRRYAHRAGTGNDNGTIAADGNPMSGVCRFIGGGWSASWETPILPVRSASPLPAQFTMKQCSGTKRWTSTMKRTSANNWGATVRQDQTGQQGSGSFTLNRVEDNRITIHHGSTGNYQGVIAADGKSISGTCDFIGGGGAFRSPVLRARHWWSSTRARVRRSGRSLQCPDDL